jgi:hypothetical protein
MDLEKEIVQAARSGIIDAIKSKLAGYGSPLDGILTGTIKNHEAELRGLVSEAFTESLGNTTFRSDIKQAVRQSLAKTLVQRFGGEIEKQVNELKSDPTTRARITLAIEEIVKSKTT